jgi:hypothetical protein
VVLLADRSVAEDRSAVADRSVAEDRSAVADPLAADWSAVADPLVEDSLAAAEDLLAADQSELAWMWMAVDSSACWVGEESLFLSVWALASWSS